jgi:hypothetical protein
MKQGRYLLVERKHFEANLLDGENIYNCGKAMISAELVWKYLLNNSMTFRDTATYNYFKFRKREKE